MTLALPSLTGELLTDADAVRVIVRPSVLREARHEFTAPAGYSMAEIIAAYGGSISSRARIHAAINGEAVARDWWARVRLKPGTMVTLVGVPGRGSLRTILAAVVTVAATVIAPMISAPIIGAFGLTAGGIGAGAVTGLVGAGISIAGALAVNALFPASRPSFDRLSPDFGDRSPSYAIGGARNEARPYGPIPVVLGRHRHSPPYGAQPYTEVFGDDQYLRLLFVWGYGPIQVNDIRIGETPISEFEGVSIRTRQMLSDGAIGIYPQVTFEEQLFVTLSPPKEFSVRRTAADIDEFTVDVAFPEGVFRFRRKNGRRVSYTVTVRVQYSAVGSGGWTNAGDIVVRSSELDPLRRSVRVEVPRGQYDVRVAKWSDEYDGDDTVGENVVWTSLKSRRDEAPIRPDKPLTVSAIRIKASEELSGVVATLNAVCHGLVRSWNGSEWVNNQKSSNPADLFRHVLQGPANARPVSNAQIDLPNLQEWHAYCEAEGFAFNQVRDFSASVFETLRDIAAAGRAAVSLRDGKWGVVWDAGATDIVQHFTPRNSSSFRAARAYADLPHAWRVRFLNQRQRWLQDERIVYDDGYNENNATKFEGIDFAGVTHPDLIWRHGRYHIAQLRLRRETHELDTDFEHLVATRGDRVRVQHDVAMWGRAAGRVKAVSGQDVTLDEPVEMEAGTTYTLRFRRDDGETLERTVIGADGTFHTVTLDGSGDVPEPGDLFMAGEIGKESVVLRVLAVMPREDLGARLVLVDDAPEIADAESGPIPPFNTQITGDTDFSTQRVTPVSAVETLVEMVNAVRSRVRVSWNAPELGDVLAYQVSWRLRDATEWTTESVSSKATRHDIFDLTAGLHDIQVRALFRLGSVSAWGSTTINVALAYAVPDDVTGFRISVNGDTATLQWDDPDDILVSGYIIRFSPITTGEVPWSAAAPLLSTGRVQSVQVPARAGTYLIRAVTHAGTRAEAPARIVSSISGITPFNVVELVEVHPEWAGDKESVHIDDDNRLRLAAGSDLFAADDWFGPGDFFFQDAGVATSGVYTFSEVIDLGQVYTSLVTVFLDAFGVNTLDNWFARTDAFEPDDWFDVDPEAWSAAVDVSTTDDDPAAGNWSDWAEIGAANIAARAFRFRLRLETSDPAITPVVQALAAEVDMPDRVIGGDDLVAPVEGRTVTFSPAFRVLQGIGIAAQELVSGDTYEITGKSEAGFTIIFRDSGGAPVERSFDYVAKGYGKVNA